MHRVLTIGIVLVLLGGAVLAPAVAQGDLTPEEQAALAEARAAYEKFIAADSFHSSISQTIDQHIAVSAQGQDVVMVQTISGEGEADYAKSPTTGFPNMEFTFTQTVAQQMDMGASNTQSMTIGPMVMDLIALEGEAFMKWDVPAEVAGMYPEEWINLDDAAVQYPALAAIDMAQLLEMSGGAYTVEYVNALFDEAVTGIEILEPGETDEGEPLNRYRLGIDLRTAIEQLGVFDINELLSAMGLPLDVEALMEQMLSDEKTVYELEVAVDPADQTLREIVVTLRININIDPSLFEDETLAGAVMSLDQTTVQRQLLSNYNEPVEITAPELGTD